MTIQVKFTSKQLMKRAGLCALLGALAVSQSACSSVGDALGMGKSPPDEFAVVTKAPLIVPPDFSLRPPKPGQPRPQELQPTESARAALVGEAGEGEVALTAGQQALLQKAQADRVDPNIRAVLNEEAGGLRNKDEGFTDKVLFWREGQSAPTGTPLNASAESERLKSGVPTGEPSDIAPLPSAEDELVGGEGASIKKKNGGFFGKIKDIF